MCGGVEDFLSGSQFYNATGIHDGHTVGDLRDDCEIVRDEEHRQSEFGAQFREQGEDLGLDSDVERGGGFVGDEQLGTVHDGHGDHDALAHAPGKLMWIVVGAAVGLGDSDFIHGFNSTLPGLSFWNVVVRQNSFRYLVADPHDGIEGGHGLLENHGDAGTAKFPHGAIRESREVAGRAIFCKEDFTREPGLLWKQAHDSERGDRFARAGFADQAEDFSGSDSEVEITDRWHGSRGKNRPVLSGSEFYVQVADVEKRGHAVMLAANSRPAGDGQPRACPEPAEGALSLHKALPVTANESSQSAAASLMLRL